MDIGKISSAGIGSGLDVNGIVTQLMALERRPIQILEAGKTKLNTQLSGLGRLQSAVTALSDAARKLTGTTGWTANAVTSSDAAISATSNGSTPPGSYAVNVSRLASAQSLTSAVVPAPSFVVGTGTLTIEMGQWFTNPPDFTPNAGASSVSINILPGDDTLEDIRDRINASDAPVIASIITDTTGSRLAIRSEETGNTQGFRISVADDDANDTDGSGLSMLAYDARSASPMTRAMAAGNAQLTVNNIPISAATNNLSNAVDGLSLRLSRTTTAPVDITVNRDNDAIKKNITDFADAYNGLVRLLREQTAYNEASQTGGALQGDRMAVGMLNKLRSLVGASTGATTSFTRLADVGLTPQRDGTLLVDSTKLDAAVGRLDELRTFFSRDDTGTANDGFGTMLRQFADLQTGSTGVLTTRQEGLRDRVRDIDDRAERMEDRMTLTEKRLREQYQRLDNSMASLNGLQSYVAQQMAILNRNTGSR